MVPESQSSGMKSFASDREVVPQCRTRLAVGDLVVITLVVLVGMVRHGENPAGRPLMTLATLGPFVLGWVCLAGLLSIYTDTQTVGWSGSRVALGAWLGAANVGLILRGSPVLPGGLTWPFPLVITGGVGLGLVAWRRLAARLLGDGDDNRG